MREPSHKHLSRRNNCGTTEVAVNAARCAWSRCAKAKLWLYFSLLLILVGQSGTPAHAADDLFSLEPPAHEQVANDSSASEADGTGRLSTYDQATGAQAAIDRAAPCSSCHDDSHGAGRSILQSVHGVAEDSRTPFAAQACITCHGPSLQHRTTPPSGTARTLPDITFRGEVTPAATKNTQCLQCHQRDLTAHWRGSIHEAQNLACTSCHTVHTKKDKILDKRSQPQLCLTCHQEKRAQMLRPSSHPLRDGQMSCTDCHNPHGSTGPQQLVKGTVNETCYTCHAEKRGPFLWEHAPVREDCTICHQPHGSVHQAMLKNRAPWLCQQCHLAQYHPSTAYSGTGLPTQASPAQQMLGKNCLNCHSAIHGSNHPAGARKTR